MNETIEFVNRKIKDKKDQLKKLEKLKVTTSNKYKLQIIELLRKNAGEDIKHLEKIKWELEAWEVVKEELQIVFKGKNHYGEPLRRYELNVIGQNKIDTLNKAMEVEKC